MHATVGVNLYKWSPHAEQSERKMSSSGRVTIKWNCYCYLFLHWVWLILDNLLQGLLFWRCTGWTCAQQVFPSWEGFGRLLKQRIAALKPFLPVKGQSLEAHRACHILSFSHWTMHNIQYLQRMPIFFPFWAYFLISCFPAWLLFCFSAVGFSAFPCFSALIILCLPAFLLLCLFLFFCFSYCR